MARFIGTPEEFYELFGGNLLTKAVEEYTKEYKKMMGYKCQHKGLFGKQCTNKIQAAHIHENGSRKQISLEILSKYVNKDGLVDIDINVFLSEFYKAHKPLHKSIKILCTAHHGLYDTNKKEKNNEKDTLYGMPKEKIEREGNYSIEYSPNENEIIESLKNSGKCYIHYHLIDGDIITRIWENKRATITKENLQNNVVSKQFVKDYNKRIGKIIVSSLENP